MKRRLCAGVKVDTHELRLHLICSPVGLGGAPTLYGGRRSHAGGEKYWNSVRRALLREPIQRIGLGGYLHLVQDYPDFCDYIEQVGDEFRTFGSSMREGKPYSIRTKVAVLHYWGKLRSLDAFRTLPWKPI